MREYDHYKWWEDKNRTIYVVNKSWMAQSFNVSLKTIDDWIRKGAPVLNPGKNGVSYEIDITAFGEWVEAHQNNISIDEVRRRREACDRELFERFAPLEELEAENRKLSAEVKALRAELAALRREIRARAQ